MAHHCSHHKLLQLVKLKHQECFGLALLEALDAWHILAHGAMSAMHKNQKDANGCGPPYYLWPATFLPGTCVVCLCLSEFQEKMPANWRDLAFSAWDAWGEAGEAGEACKTGTARTL